MANGLESLLGSCCTSFIQISVENFGPILPWLTLVYTKAKTQYQNFR